MTRQPIEWEGPMADGSETYEAPSVEQIDTDGNPISTVAGNSGPQ
jgi:hypothetical protein